MHYFLDIGLAHYLILAAILFVIGLIGVLVSRHIIRILMCIEIMLTAININFVAFANYTDIGQLNGQIFALFVMVISALEMAIGLAILLAFYKNKPSVDIKDFKSLKG